MPAIETPPSVDDFLDAAEAGVQSKNSVADTLAGSRYDIWSGVSAVLLARVAQRARGRFRNAYFDTADDDALDEIVELQYDELEPRTLATAGTGTLTLVRATSAAGGDTIHAGMRVAYLNAMVGGIRYYQVSEDRVVGATDLSVVLPIEAYQAGTGQGLDSLTADGRLQLEDAIFDPTFIPTSLICADGTDRESGDALRSRVRTQRQAERVGYETAITAAMKRAGASEVRLFASNHFGDNLDHGLNRVYVADVAFHTSDALLSACRLAAFECVMWGASTNVLPLTSANLSVGLTLTLWNPISASSRGGLAEDAKRRMMDYIDRNPFVWTLDGLAGAARRVSQDISDVAVTTSVVEPDVATMFDTPPLTRWTLPFANISVSFV